MLWSAASSSFCLLLSGSVSCARSGKNTDLRPSISHVVFSAPLLDFCWRCPGACLATGASGRLFALTCCCAAAPGFSTSNKAAACQTLTCTPEIREITFVIPFWSHFWEVEPPLHGTPLCAVLQMISPPRTHAGTYIGCCTLRSIFRAAGPFVGVPGYAVRNITMLLSACRIVPAPAATEVVHEPCSSHRPHHCWPVDRYCRRCAVPHPRQSIPFHN